MESIRNFLALGTAKVLFAFAWAITGNASNYVELWSNSGKYAEATSVKNMDHAECDFPVCSLSGHFDLQEMFTEMTEAGTQVAICNATEEKLLELISCSKTMAIFSACREGLLTTYMPILEKINRKIDVFVLDNDNTIVDRAKALCKNGLVSFHQAVIHAVCSNVEFDKKHGTITLTADNSVDVVFPPEALWLKDHIIDTSQSLFSSRARFKFCESPTEFEYFCKSKIIDVNGIHTLISLAVYHKGLKEGVSLKKIADSTFADYISLDELLKIASTGHSKMYKSLITNTERMKEYEEEEGVHQEIMKCFVRRTYDSRDKIKRGVDFEDAESVKKMHRHLEYLKWIIDPEVQNILYEVLTYLKDTGVLT